MDARTEVPRKIVLSRPKLPVLPAAGRDREFTARMVTLYHLLRSLADDARAFRASRC